MGPTQKLVVSGRYRHVRNPMISGVAMMLIGQSLFWGSWIIGLWAGIFALINHVYFIFSEEPGLEKRFGESYLNYSPYAVGATLQGLSGYFAFVGRVAPTECA